MSEMHDRVLALAGLAQALRRQAARVVRSAGDDVFIVAVRTETVCREFRMDMERFARHSDGIRLTERIVVPIADGMDRATPLNVNPLLHG